MTLRYFNLRLVERNWIWIATYDFAKKKKKNFNSLFFWDHGQSLLSIARPTF